MVWGTQQTNLFPGAKVEGVFGMWYGKGPGVDRTGDVFKHANAAGTAPKGGVLALAADDHACRSSTLPHGSEHEFVSAMMPVLNPAGVQDILDLGLLGWAMSRYTGRWVGFKTIAETVESSASVDVDPLALRIVLPEDFEMPRGGLNIRWPDPPMDQEMRLHQYAVKAAQAFARANGIDRVVIDSPNARLGIITTGKSYLDVLQALEYLDLDARACADLGIRVYKVAMTWPLEPVGLRNFARGLAGHPRGRGEARLHRKPDEGVDVQLDRRPAPVDRRQVRRSRRMDPAVHGRTHAGAHRARHRHAASRNSTTANTCATCCAGWKRRNPNSPCRARAFPRVPHYCSGCPHNTSTVVPEGSRALGGIGCHYMVTWMDRSTDTFTHMGGEGVTWAGQAAFTETPHVFQNLGDGTYFHSGSLAIRQSIAAGVNITYKILYNDAVAMTGGQPVDGTLSVPQIAHQVRSEGVQAIVVLSDEIGKWSDPSIFPVGVEFLDRTELDAVQKRLREMQGTIGADLRPDLRDRKAPPPQARQDGRSAEARDDQLAGLRRLRRLRQEVVLRVGAAEGNRVRPQARHRPEQLQQGLLLRQRLLPELRDGARRFAAQEERHRRRRSPAPTCRCRTLPALDQPWNILITGVGGTGVVTIGALLGMAGHLEGKGASVLDQTGLAQKGGAVTTHIRIANSPADIHAVRIAAGEADLVLGCDMVVVNDYWPLSKIRSGRTQVVLNSYEAMPGTFTTRPDMQFPAQDIVAAIKLALGGNERATACTWSMRRSSRPR